MSNMLNLINRVTEPLARRVRLMVGRAVVSSINDSGNIQSVQVELLSGEVRDDVEVLQPYGLSAYAPGRREGLYFSVGGDRDHGVMVAVGDRQYRFRNLKSGEVVIYDDQDQTIHLTREGIVIKGAGKPVIIKDTPKVRMETPLFECTGEIKDQCDASGRTMSAMRSTYDAHTHNGYGGQTSVPNQRMG